MKILSHLASRIFDTALAIQPEKLEVILHAIGPRLGADLTREEAVALGVQAGMGPAEGRSEKTYQVTGEGIAIIPIQGTLMKKCSGLMALSGLASYARIRQQMEDARQDPEIRGILLDIDSPGGETHGCFELSDLIYSMRGEKPIYAAANDCALSAAYALASAADRIFVTRTGAVGSIGVFALHVDQSAADEKIGLKFTYIHAGKKKVDGNPHEPLSRSAKSDAQTEVDREYEIFVNTVSRNRKKALEAIAETEAGVFFAEAAIPLLADEIGTVEDALSAVTEKATGVKSGGFSALGGFPSMPAIAPHKTATVKKAWNGPEAKRRLREDENQSYYEKAFAFRKDDGDPKTKSGYSFIHHEVSAEGEIGAANVRACQTAIGVLNGARGGGGRRKYAASEREGIYRHVAKHIRDAGEEPAELKSQAEYEQLYAANAAQSNEGETSMAKPSQLLAFAAKKAEDAEAKRAKAKKARKKADDAEEYAKKMRQEADDAEAEEAEDADQKCKKADDVEADAKRLSEEAEAAESQAEGAEAESKKARKKATGMRVAGERSEPEEDEDDEDEEDEEEEDEEDMEDRKKKGRKAAIASGAKQIADLCTLAGYPEMAAEFISKEVTVAEVQKTLLDKRAAVANDPSHQVNPNFGAVGTAALDQLETQAAAIARTKGVSKTRAYEMLLSSQEGRQAYANYRKEKRMATANEMLSERYLAVLAQRLAVNL